MLTIADYRVIILTNHCFRIAYAIFSSLSSRLIRVF